MLHILTVVLNLLVMIVTLLLAAAGLIYECEALSGTSRYVPNFPCFTF